MTTPFEDEVGFVLASFRSGEKNYAEAMVAIEELVLRCLGFAGAIDKVIKEAQADQRVDAERYRWLRAHAKEIIFRRGEDPIVCYDPTYDKPDDLDAAIDGELEKDPVKPSPETGTPPAPGPRT